MKIVISEKSKEKSSSEGLVPIKPIPQFKKTKSNRNVFDKDSTKSSGASSKLLSIPVLSKGQQEGEVKHKSHKNLDQIVEKTDLKSPDDIKNSNFLQVGPQSTKRCNIFMDLAEPISQDELKSTDISTINKIKLSKMGKCSSEVVEKHKFVNKYTKPCPEISVLSFEDKSENSKAQEMQILEKEASTESTMDDDCYSEDILSQEYLIPPKMLMSLEMQEAILAIKLISMYERKMHMDKSSFYRLKDNYISESSDSSEDFC